MRIVKMENGETQFIAEEPRVTFSSVVLRPGPVHDAVTVFNRGANAGTLVVVRGDGEFMARKLME